MELKITIDDASIAKLADAIAARIGGTPAPVEAPVPTNTPNAVPAPAKEEAPAATSLSILPSASPAPTRLVEILLQLFDFIEEARSSMHEILRVCLQNG